MRIGLLQDPHDTVRELRHALSCDTNIPQEQVQSLLFHNNQPYSKLPNKQTLAKLMNLPEKLLEKINEPSGNDFKYCGV